MSLGDAAHPKKLCIDLLAAENHFILEKLDKTKG